MTFKKLLLSLSDFVLAPACAFDECSDGYIGLENEFSKDCLGHEKAPTVGAGVVTGSGYLLAYKAPKE